MPISDRGFASMNKKKQREIASKGGRAAHARGTAYNWDSETARIAGKKGGLASQEARRKRRQQATSEPATQTSPTAATS